MDAAHAAQDDLRSRLTPREREVAQLAAQGLSNAEVAATLCLATGTVRNHLSNVYAKLHLRRRSQLPAFFRGPSSLSTAGHKQS